MGKAFQRDAVTIADVLVDDFLQGAELHRSFHPRLRLLAQVLRQVIERAIAFPVEPEPFQPPKGW